MPEPKMPKMPMPMPGKKPPKEMPMKPMHGGKK